MSRKTKPHVLISPGSSSEYSISNKLRKLGATCEIVAPSEKHQVVQQKYNRATHIILGGGGDVDPSRYGQDNVYSTGISTLRDKLEFKLLRWAARDRKPLLGICRGNQIMSVFFGAELIQDIENEGYNLIEHWGKYHEAHAIKGGFVRDVVQKVKFETNSYHHQAVREDTMPDDLYVVALSYDGIVEAVQHRSLPMYGIQSHPETQNTPWAWLLFSMFIHTN